MSDGNPTAAAGPRWPRIGCTTVGQAFRIADIRARKYGSLPPEAGAGYSDLDHGVLRFVEPIVGAMTGEQLGMVALLHDLPWSM